MRILVITLLLLQLKVLAVTQAPLVLRACVNNDDSTVTLSWNPVADACGSFTEYTIYGNENSGPYATVTRISTINTSAHSFKIPNLNNKRNYYITVRFLCDLQDSATSNIVAIDKIKPPLTQLKRVSYDIGSQNIIAEWWPNPEPDTKGYRLYNQIGIGVNDSIDETTDTFRTVTTDPNNVFDVTHATYDSCLLFSPISDPHRVSRLSASFDTCARELSLSWTLYKGWSQIDSQSLYVSINGGTFVRHSTYAGNIKSTIINNVRLGDTLCYYLTAYTNLPEHIYSHSNKVCLETRAFELPSYLYLSYVTVLDDQSIGLEWVTDNVTDIGSFDLYRGTANGSQVAYVLDQPSSPSVFAYYYNDVAVQTSNEFYNYSIEAYNRCDELVTTSNTSNSILLKLDASGNYNNYNNWDGGVDQYVVLASPDQGSTWSNFIVSGTNQSFVYPDSQLCYRIEAQEKLNSYGFSAKSHSNIVCTDEPLRVFAPNAMVIGGTNDRFIVQGTGIDHTKSSYEIYNRWGQNIVTRSTDQPWYGDYRGEPVMMGMYIFIINIQGLNGEKETIKGVLRIIE